MSAFREKPVEIEAHQWWKNGDHPEDDVGEDRHDLLTGGTYTGIEGKVVRYFRRPEPEHAGGLIHEPCDRTWDDHGWIDILEGGHTVCPGDWVITGVQGERYPCKPAIFEATYQRASSSSDAAADVDLVHNLLVGGLADGEDPLDRLGVEDDLILLRAPGRLLRIRVDRS